MEQRYKIHPLGFPWKTRDPFLFCVHHLDAYPSGNQNQGISKEHLQGRDIGMDFEIKDGFRMYHGEEVPGFPAHPHRGFETITLARQGYIDHSDSLGATARFGDGDVQWMTAGQGIVHSEMFPLTKPNAPNTGELFQIWLNLPAKNKMVEPHFSMLWSETIPRKMVSPQSPSVKLTVMAGAYEDLRAPRPPPNSWAAHAESDVAIWTVEMEPGAEFVFPKTQERTQRSLYFFSGASIELEGQALSQHRCIELSDHKPFRVRNGDTPAELLLLQGKPIAEPVARHGPFVMNTRAELVQAFEDYQHTQFGGWPWGKPDPVHDRAQGRFAQRPSGAIETPT